MARKVMDGGFRRIKHAAAPAVPEPDPRLALVDLFAAGQSAPQVAAEPEPQDAQEAPVAPEPEPTDAGAPDETEAADGAPGPEDEPVSDRAPADEKDYDPIAAVLG